MSAAASLAVLTSTEVDARVLHQYGTYTISGGRFSSV